MRCSTRSDISPSVCARPSFQCAVSAQWPRSRWVILGLFMNSGILIDLGIWAFALSTVFQLVTLPVEVNASNRARRDRAGDRPRTSIRWQRRRGPAAVMTYFGRSP